MLWVSGRAIPKLSSAAGQSLLDDMVFSDSSRVIKNSDDDDFIMLEKEKSTKVPIRQSLHERLRLSEIKKHNLEMDLRAVRDFLITAEAEHSRELRDKEFENSRIVKDLQEQLNEARGQLYGGQTQTFNFIPEPHNPENTDSDYRMLTRRLTELAWFRGRYPDVLIEAAVMVCNKSYQKALIHLDTSMSASNSTALQANATLLQSNVLRISDNPTRGLELSEQVVHIANQNGWPILVGKAQFYRGLCLFDLGLYADAIRCYVRAASVRWYAREITCMINIAEEKRNALPIGNRGKQVSEGFQEIPQLPDTSPM